MGEKETFRVNITLQEYDSDGFWDVFHYTEISYGKKELEESLENIIINCKKYIKNKVK
jgi:hypothetical protein